jgi:Nucleoside 2-deoxyribosyltransferase like
VTRLVMAREPLPVGLSVFLAGPTHSDATQSWRPAAFDALADQWTGSQPLAVLSPESRGGQRAERYDQQVRWEFKARAGAAVILYWIPRDMTVTPGMTTNVEFGYDVARGRRVVLGCPPDCPDAVRNRYLIFLAHDHCVPVRETLQDTVAAVVKLLVAV